jgi:small subunit ribosomal protein S1
VTKVVTFGAFIEILPGVEGLVHISELAQHHVENPREIVSQGEVVKVKIIEMDADRRRLSLSLKRVDDLDEVRPPIGGLSFEPAPPPAAATEEAEEDVAGEEEVAGEEDVAGDEGEGDSAEPAADGIEDAEPAASGDSPAYEEAPVEPAEEPSGPASDTEDEPVAAANEPIEGEQGPAEDEPTGESAPD